MEKNINGVIVCYIRTDNTPADFNPTKDQRVTQRHVCRDREEAERIAAQLRLIQFIEPESIEIIE